MLMGHWAATGTWLRFYVFTVPQPILTGIENVILDHIVQCPEFDPCLEGLLKGRGAALSTPENPRVGVYVLYPYTTYCIPILLTCLHVKI